MALSIATGSISEDSFEQSSAGRFGPDDASLAVLDNAYRTKPIDNALLSPESAGLMRRAINGALVTISDLDIRKLTSRQGWLQRLTGADIEARLTFELAAGQVDAALDALQAASTRARGLLAAMDEERRALGVGQGELSRLIAFGEAVSARGDGDDPTIGDRFRRRLANLTAMHTANEMALIQFRLAADGLKGLLDRYTDMATVVIPLWRQHLFAILHARGPVRFESSDVQDFVLCQSALQDYFKGELQA